MTIPVMCNDKLVGQCAARSGSLHDDKYHTSSIMIFMAVEGADLYSLIPKPHFTRPSGLLCCRGPRRAAGEIGII